MQTNLRINDHKVIIESKRFARHLLNWLLWRTLRSILDTRYWQPKRFEYLRHDLTQQLIAVWDVQEFNRAELRNWRTIEPSVGHSQVISWIPRNDSNEIAVSCITIAYIKWAKLFNLDINLFVIEWFADTVSAFSVVSARQSLSLFCNSRLFGLMCCLCFGVKRSARITRSHFSGLWPMA